MSRGRFDEHCPYCSQSLTDEIYPKFVNSDYATDFAFECRHCGNEIQCDVHQVPEFELNKAQTPEEYKAMVAKMRKIVDAVELP